MSVVLKPISAEAAAAVRAGREPQDVRVEADYPTEFSTGVAENVGHEGAVGPFFVHRADDDVVIGEIGGSFVEPTTVEVGYALVASQQGRGHGSATIRAFLDKVREMGGAQRVRGHTPLDRPASGRILEKAGFAAVGEFEDEDGGVLLTVRRWELEL